MEELVSISGFLLISKCTNEMKFYNCPPVLWEIKRRYVSQWDKKEGKDLSKRNRWCFNTDRKNLSLAERSLSIFQRVSIFHLEKFLFHRLDVSSTDENREKTISFLHFIFLLFYIFLIFILVTNDNFIILLNLDEWSCNRKKIKNYKNKI